MTTLPIVDYRSFVVRSPLSGFSTAEHMERANKALIVYLQRLYYEEIAAQSQGERIPIDCLLRKLQLDVMAGVVVAVGRLTHAMVTKEAKHPSCAANEPSISKEIK